MDWANQPDPFRRYEGSPLIPLPLLKPDEALLSPLYEDLYLPGASAPVTVRALSRFLEYSQAISAWKQAGEVRWALRTNPSSGNLHPTEGYLLIDTVPSLSPFPGLYHYAPKDHGLELRAELPKESFTLLMQEFPRNAFLVGFTSVNWQMRELTRHIWHGKANRLSRDDPVQWAFLDQVEIAAWKSSTEQRAKHMSDGRLLSLLGMFLRQDIVKGVQRWTPTGGTPRGAVISPLLANIYLHPLNCWMRERGYRMVRYADDFVVLCQTAGEARAGLAAVQAWVQANALILNPDKTHVRDCREKGQGWYGYFKHAHSWTFDGMDGFVRRRLRTLLRKQQKRPGAGQTLADHHRWPNAFFADMGLFTMTEAHAQASRPR